MFCAWAIHWHPLRSQVYVSTWAGVAQVGPVVVVYAGFGNVEGLAVGLDGLPEAGTGCRLGDGLQSGDGLVIAKDFDGGALLDELEVVVEVFAELVES